MTSTGCATSDSLGFDQFSAQAKAVGAQSFVTVNYGSGTPAEAAAWVTHSETTPGDSVALWEVGNENYGCWEVNNWLAQPPENYQGYTPEHLHHGERSLREPDLPPGHPGQRGRNPDTGHVLRCQCASVPAAP